MSREVCSCLLTTHYVYVVGRSQMARKELKLLFGSIFASCYATALSRVGLRERGSESLFGSFAAACGD